MKKLRRKLFLLIILAALVYLYCVAIFRVGKDELVLVRDRASGEHIVLGPGFGFVWQGAVPGRMEISCHPLKASMFMEARVAIPPLADLEAGHYSIKIPLAVTYEIIPDDFREPPSRGLREGRPGASRIRELADKAFSAALASYVEQGYDRFGILRDREAINQKALDLVKNGASKYGISVISVEPSGPIALPELRVYQEGLMFLAELREIERQNRKELLTLKSELEREKQRKEEYLLKLSDVSRLVKSNPDLLKYIYIDRLGGDVKVIIAPEKSGMPLGLSFDDVGTAEKKKTEIDNLR